MKVTPDSNYRDQYFQRGHWLLKIRQTLVALLCWILLFIPILVTTATYWAYLTHGKRGHFFWHYAEGFQELNFLVVFLTFAVAMTAVFCLTVAYVQIQRSRGLVDKWPMYDLLKNQREGQAAEAFMADRFGDPATRHSAKHYTVHPEQNLANNQLKQVISRAREEEAR